MLIRNYLLKLYGINPLQTNIDIKPIEALEQKLSQINFLVFEQAKPIDSKENEKLQVCCFKLLKKIERCTI